MPQLRYQGISAAARAVLESEGESGRFEFKSDASAVSGSVLVAAANAVLVEQIPEGFVSILVGVEELEEPRTGTITGKVIGLRWNGAAAAVEEIKERLLGRARSTLPVPIGIRIFEENVRAVPFLRLEVWPTLPPHYTETGARSTRYLASTRAITDEELVSIYLDREADKFRERFARVAESVHTRLQGIGASLEYVDERLAEIGLDVGRIGDLASEAVDASYEGQQLAEQIHEAVQGVQEQGQRLEEMSTVLDGVAEIAWRNLQRTREGVWLRFCLTTSGCRQKKKLRLVEEALRAIPDPDLWAVEANIAELAAWRRFASACTRDRLPNLNELLELALDIPLARAHPTGFSMSLAQRPGFAT